MKAVILGYQVNTDGVNVDVVYRLQDSSQDFQSLCVVNTLLDATTDVTPADIHAKAVAAILAIAAVSAVNVDPSFAMVAGDISYLFATP